MTTIPEETESILLRENEGDAIDETSRDELQGRCDQSGSGSWLNDRSVDEPELVDSTGNDGGR